MGISRVAVLGAGLSGLMLTWKLQEAGIETIVLEAQSEVGGVGKTMVWNGFRLEAGPHHFHTREQPLAQELKQLMGGESLIQTRQNRIWFQNRWIAYPLSTRSLLEIPPTTLIQAVGELALLWSQHRLGFNLPTPPTQPGLLPKYGKVLDQLLMNEYRQKIQQVPASSLRPTWYTSISPASSPLQAAQQLLQGLFRPPKARTLTFHDPSQGFGSIAKKLEQRILAAGGQIQTNIQLRKIHAPDDEIQAIEYHYDNQEHWLPIDYLFSTIPLTTLFFRWNPIPPHSLLEHSYRLRHCSLVYLNILLPQATETDNIWWGYFPETHYSFYRASPAQLHSPSHSLPQQQSCLTVEWMLPTDHPLHDASAQQLLEEALPGLEEAKLLRKEDVKDLWVHKESRALPLEHPTQQSQLREISSYLTKIRRFRAVGQQGKFHLSPLAENLRNSLQAARSIIKESN